MTRMFMKSGIQHECELAVEEDDFALAQTVDSGYCIRLKRYLWQSILIWRDNSRSTATYRSEFVVRRENVRKLQLKNIVFHPFSILRTSWELFMCLVLGIACSLPVVCHFKQELFNLECFLLGANILDILLKFNSGYQISNTRIVVCDRRTIVKHYLTHWFIFDVMSLFGYLLYKPEIISHSHLEYGQCLILLRLPTLMQYAHNTRATYDSYQHQSYAINLLLPMFIIIIWVGHLYHTNAKAIIASLNITDTYSEINTYQFERFCCHLFVIGFNFTYGLQPGLLDILCTLAGFVIEMILLAFVFCVVLVRILPFLKYMKIIQQMDRYARNNKLPKSIRTRMHEFMEYKLEYNKFSEPAILESLPKSFRSELATTIYSQLLEKSFIFSGIPMDIILKLTAHVTSKIFMPSDVIIEAGAKADYMYFIRYGIVAVYTPNGREICHLKDGGTFGEMVLSDYEVRNATVIAVDWCDLCMLNRKHLMMEFMHYPDLLIVLKEEAQKRNLNWISKAESLSSQTTSNETSSFYSSSTTLIQI